MFGFQEVAKKLQKTKKKSAKNRTTYQKNVYLCNVLINEMIVLQI